MDRDHPWAENLRTRNGPPLKPGATLGDTGTGMLLAISILAALYRRRGTAQGERIEVAMQDAMLQYIRVALSTQATYGTAAFAKQPPAWRLHHRLRARGRGRARE